MADAVGAVDAGEDGVLFAEGCELLEGHADAGEGDDGVEDG